MSGLLPAVTPVFVLESIFGGGGSPKSSFPGEMLERTEGPSYTQLEVASK